MTAPVEASLDGFPVVVECPVAWGDMDAFGHVNNTVFFRFFESARIAYLDAIGFRGAGSTSGVGPILHSTWCRFRRPLRYPDTVRVGGRATAIAADRFTMEYRLVSAGLGAVAATGEGIVVAVDYGSGVKMPLPEPVRRAIDELEAR